MHLDGNGPSFCLPAGCNGSVKVRGRDGPQVGGHALKRRASKPNVGPQPYKHFGLVTW